MDGRTDDGRRPITCITRVLGSGELKNKTFRYISTILNQLTFKFVEYLILKIQQ